MSNYEEINWTLIEINPVCKILVYRYCVDEFCGMVKAQYPSAVFYSAKNKLFSEAIREAHVLLGWRFPEELLQNAINLKWIQLISVGLSLTEKKYDIPDYIRNDVIITTTKGLYSDSVADYVIWAILTMSRKFNALLKAQIHRNWAQQIGEDARGKIAGVLGLGEIGRAVAEKVKAIGMKVSAIKRHYTSELNIPNIDSLYPVTKLAEFLNNVDFLVICLPLTLETKGLIGRDEFKYMKNSSFVIDVSRGGIVNHKDLMWAIKNEIISGAILDVFENEPLPKDSELWNLNNVIITPHIAGITKDYVQKVGQLFSDNLERFIERKNLLNIVDRTRGY